MDYEKLSKIKDSIYRYVRGIKHTEPRTETYINLLINSNAIHSRNSVIKRLDQLYEK